MNARNRISLTEDYLRWLEPQLRDPNERPDRTYWELINLMYDTKFTFTIPMDNNRLVDGLDLRTEFAHMNHISLHLLKELDSCSFLEVLIGLSRRMAFVAGGSAPGWAWQLLNNLDLHRMWDTLSPAKRRRAQDIMYVVIHREYLPDGTGGFFPLAWPEEDMTQLELWTQLNAYVSELHPEH